MKSDGPMMCLPATTTAVDGDLCSKLEHLEEIFVHQSRQTPWPKERGGGGESKGESQATSQLRDEVATLKAENASYRKRVRRLESTQLTRPDSRSGPAFAHHGGGDAAAKKEQREILTLRQANESLERRIAKMQRREMELLQFGTNPKKVNTFQHC